MDFIKDLKELQALFKMCRKQGVTEIDVAGLHIKFGELPQKREENESDDPYSSDGLTMDELINLSVPTFPGV